MPNFIYIAVQYLEMPHDTIGDLSNHALEPLYLPAGAQDFHNVICHGGNRTKLSTLYGQALDLQ